MKVRSISLGCKVNSYESEYVLSSFKENGYEIVLDGEADVFIINTCSVTNQSDAKSRKVINRIARENPHAIIVVMGCFIEANKDYDNPNVSIIIGNKDKNKVVSLVNEYIKDNKSKKLLYNDFDLKFEDMYITHMNSRTRAFVKIQDGCENFCSYCIIPYTRGKCRSKDKDKVLSEIRELVKNGYKEVVLTGIHTGHYGSDINSNLGDLLEEIVKIDNLQRLRLSSIEITELDDKFLKILNDEKVIVSHMHIPLQAGSDEILKLMNRKYDTKYFEDKINKIRSIRPDISITTDVIVGFPGEDERLFKETYDFIKKIKFTKLHVFPYSSRHGTKAETMPNQVSEQTKKERVKELLALSKNLEREYLEKFVGKVVSVLIETSGDISVGHTGNYLMVKVRGEIPHNEIVNVMIDKVNDNYLEGTLYEEN